VKKRNAIAAFALLFAIVAASGLYAIENHGQLGPAATAAALPQTELYTVSYDANGGEGDPPADGRAYTKYESVKVLSISSGALTRPGYRLAGFALLATGTPIAEFTITSDTTLYAVWKAAEYSVTYDANGGTGEVPAPTTGVKHGDVVAVAGAEGCELTKDGYILAGFGLSADEGPIDSFAVMADSVLYAVWEEATYHVRYDANGGAGDLPSDATAYAYLSTVTTEPALGLSREGYSFAGFAVEEGGAPVSSFAIESDTTLFAVWGSEGTYRLVYDANGGSGPVPVDTREYKEGESAPVASSPQPVRAGYSFAGWSKSKTGGILPSKVNMTANTTLYAAWEPIRYTVRFEAGGAAGSLPENETVDAGASYTPPPSPALSKPGYSFAGWSEGAAGPVEAAFEVNADMTLYAIWEPERYAVSYDSAGGKGEAPKDTSLYEFGQVATIASEADLKKEGYSLMGFSPILGGAPVDIWLMTDDITMYAVWADSAFAIYTVTFEDGQSVQIREATSLAPALGIFMPDDPYREGASFRGWYTLAEDGAKAAFTASTPVAADTTVYADFSELPASAPAASGGSKAKSAVFLCAVLAFAVLLFASLASLFRRRSAKQKQPAPPPTQNADKNKYDTIRIIEDWGDHDTDELP